MKFTITQNGEILDPSKYTWDEKTKTLSTEEDDLFLDFADMYGVTFKTLSTSTFKTGDGCTFYTGSDCTFDTLSDCTFNTGDNCTFKTLYDCTFNTGDGCIFYTLSDCTFNTGSDCTFKIGHGCILETGNSCICTRRDIHEVIETPEKTKIKMNGFEEKGYTLADQTHYTFDNEELKNGKN